MDQNKLSPGDKVVLLTKPDGCTSRFYPLTVGNTYTILDLSGSNVITTTDDPEIDGHYWRGRVEKIPQNNTPN